MEQVRIARTLPIQEWSVGKTTLDEVFLEIVNRYGGVTGGAAAITNAQQEGAKTASMALPGPAGPAGSTTATDNEGGADGSKSMGVIVRQTSKPDNTIPHSNSKDSLQGAEFA